MHIRITEHPGQTLITLQTGPRAYLTLPATPVPTDWPESREYDIPSLSLTSLDVSVGRATEEPQR
ncbi:hypothetical protein [Embleya sp. NPDC059237]|uniref:hypothetical protein n=1 Tax=Embleya sp. NPDC059237 TaxID=3346784 RepID=UPI0036C0E8DB